MVPQEAAALLAAILNTVRDVLPIVLVLLVFQVLVLRQPIANLGRVLTGFAYVVAGLALFPSFEAPAPPEGVGLLVQTLEPHNPAHLGLSAASPPRLETMLLPEGVPEP